MPENIDHLLKIDKPIERLRPVTEVHNADELLTALRTADKAIVFLYDLSGESGSFRRIFRDAAPIHTDITFIKVEYSKVREPMQSWLGIYRVPFLLGYVNHGRLYRTEFTSFDKWSLQGLIMALRGVPVEGVREELRKAMLSELGEDIFGEELVNG